MSKELRMSGRLVFDDGDGAVSLDKGEQLVDSSGKQPIKHTQNVGTSEEALDTGDLTFPCLASFFNKDATNYVDIYLATGDTNAIRIKKREQQGPIRLTAAPFAKANTAAVNLEYMLVED